MKKIKVATVVSDFFDGRVQAAAVAIANGLSEIGFSVEALSLGGEGPLADTFAPRIEVKALSSGRRERVDEAARWLVGTDAQAVIAHGAASGPMQAAHARADSGAKLITVDHGGVPLGKFERFMQRWSRSHDEAQAAAVRVSAAVGALESITARRLAAYPSDVRRTIYDPVITPDVRRMKAEPFDHRWFERFEPNELPVIVAVGEQSPEHNAHDVLIRAFAAANTAVKARLIVIREGGISWRLGRLARHLGVGDRVELAGDVPNAIAYLSRADLFVLSSTCEAMPSALIEALYCGTPVVSTDCDFGPREILQGGRLGTIVPAGDHIELGSAILRALQSPPTEERREALRARGAQFDDMTSAETYARLIEELVIDYLSPSRE